MLAISGKQTRSSYRPTKKADSAPLPQEPQPPLESFVSDPDVREVLPTYLKEVKATRLKGEDKKVPFDGVSIYQALNQKGALHANRWLQLKRNFNGIEVALPKTVGDIVRTMSDLANVSHRNEVYDNEYGLALYVGDTGRIRATVQRGGGAFNPDVKGEFRVQFPDGEKAQNIGVVAHSHIDGPPRPSPGDHKYMRGLSDSPVAALKLGVLAVPSLQGLPLYSVFTAGGTTGIGLDLADKMPLEALFAPYYQDS